MPRPPDRPPRPKALPALQSQRGAPPFFSTFATTARGVLGVADVGGGAWCGFSPRGTAMGAMVNGWDVARDNNGSKSVGGQIALTPVAALSIIINGMWGPEQAGNDRDPRTLWDGVVIFK